MEEIKKFMKSELMDIKLALSKLLLISDTEIHQEVKDIKARIDNLYLFLSGR